MKVTLLSHTPIEVVAEATAKPYRSNPTSSLVTRVWESGHKSIGRHGMASFLVEGVSVSLLIQLSRHPFINLTVESSRYCDMSDKQTVVPPYVKSADLTEYLEDMETMRDIYSKWQTKPHYYHKERQEISKMFIPRGFTVDLVMSGNYQALYEFCQLRSCIRAEWEIRALSDTVAYTLIDAVPAIFKAETITCRGAEFGVCPESNSCGLYPTAKQLQKSTHNIS